MSHPTTHHHRPHYYTTPVMWQQDTSTTPVSTGPPPPPSTETSVTYINDGHRNNLPPGRKRGLRERQNQPSPQQRKRRNLGNNRHVPVNTNGEAVDTSTLPMQDTSNDDISQDNMSSGLSNDTNAKELAYYTFPLDELPKVRSALQLINDVEYSSQLSSEELLSLREELDSLRNTARERTRLLRQEIKKLNVIQGLDIENDTTEQVNDISSSSNKICGVINSRGKPCQRTGFCPFHHKRQNNDTSTFEPSTNSTKISEDNSSSPAGNGVYYKDRNTSRRVSILLIAAAAIERESTHQIDTEEKQNQSTTISRLSQRQQEVELTNAEGVQMS